MISQIHIQVFGAVQGVCFRAYVRNIAVKLGLVGFVKNLPNGSVEVVAEGEKEKLEELLEFCYSGPSAASVSDIQFIRSESSKKFKKFEIRK